MGASTRTESGEIGNHAAGDGCDRWQQIGRIAASLMFSGAACVGLAAADDGIAREARAAEVDGVRQQGKETKDTKDTKNTGETADPKAKSGERTLKEGQSGAAAQAVPVSADLSLLDEVEPSCWNSLASKRIYFAHQLRGDEVVRGLEDVLAARPSIGWSVRQQGAFAGGEGVFSKPGFVHGPAGADGDPSTKIDRFTSYLRSGDGAQVDIAVLDFSMHDFERATDPEKLFVQYRDAVETLHRERPTLTILAATVPLACPEKGVRERMRRMMGTTGNVSNAVRGRFNDLVRAHFGKAATIDFAHAESERADLAHCSVIVGGVRWPARCPENMTDNDGSATGSKDGSTAKSDRREKSRTENSEQGSSSAKGRHANADGIYTLATRQALARELLVAFARTCNGGPAATAAAGSD